MDEVREEILNRYDTVEKERINCQNEISKLSGKKAQLDEEAAYLDSLLDKIDTK